MATPVEELRKAADRLEKLLDALVQDPDPTSWGLWITTMQPAVGRTLVALLLEVAVSVEEDAGVVQDATTESVLTTARAINAALGRTNTPESD